MRTIDEKDIEIVELLLEDARRPYSEIANQVDLSPPTVSDRIDRLREDGVIRRFTLDVEESKIDDQSALLVEFDVEPDATDQVQSQLNQLSRSGRIYTTAESTVIAELRAAPESAGDLIADTVDMSVVETYDIKIVTTESWSPSVSAAKNTSETAVSTSPNQD